MNVLVTGATGLVGSEVVERLREERGAEVIGVSRHRARAAPTGVAWDMAREAPPPSLRRRWDLIVHAAADTRWTMSAEDATRANVATVEALAPLAFQHTHVVHVSTAFATGLCGDGASTALSDYRNTYEWSKASAERLARASFSNLTIVRPPLVVGRRRDGRAARFAGMYTILRGLASSMVPAIVGDADAPFEVVPVDDLAAVIAAHATGKGSGEVLTIAGGERALRVGEALEVITGTFNAWRLERGLEPLQVPRLMSPESWERFFVPFARDELSPRQRGILELLNNFRPYLTLSRPLSPKHPVTDVKACISHSVRFWAEVNSRVASLPPTPWRKQ